MILDDDDEDNDDDYLFFWGGGVENGRTHLNAFNKMV